MSTPNIYYEISYIATPKILIFSENIPFDLLFINYDFRFGIPNRFRETRINQIR